MKHFKRMMSLCLTLALLLGLAACGRNAGEETKAKETQTEETARESEATQAPEQEEEPSYTVRGAALKGPTAMGLVKLLDQFGVVETPQAEPLVEERSENGGSYNFMLAAAADQVSPSLIKGDLDVACVPANLASTLYNKTNGQIVTLGINTLGVIYIVEKGETLQSLKDLKGKTMVASGKGSTPEYGLRYLLEQNGIDPDKDITIEWKSEHSECVAAMASGAADIAMLPQPFVTVAQGKIEGLRIALDLAGEWASLDNGSAMLTGVVVARKSFIEEQPDAVEAFLADYAASVEWVNSNVSDAAALIGAFNIVEAAVAEKALPYCNITCITGDEMKEKLSGYLTALYEQDPSAIGGALPGDDFYFA